MTSTPIPLIHALRRDVMPMRFTYTVLLAIAANFLLVEGHDQQRCIELTVVAAGLVHAFFSGTAARAVAALPAAGRRMALAILLLGLCATVGVFSPARAVAEWSMFAMLGVAGAVIAAEYGSASVDQQYRLLQTIGWVAAMYALRLLLVYAAAINAGTRLNFHLLAVGFSNARFLNHAQTPLIPMLFLLGALRPENKGTRALACTTAAVWWAVLFYSEGRATLLALGTATMAVCILRRGLALPYLKTMMMTVAGGIALYLALFFVIPILAGMPAWGMPQNVIARSMADPASNRLVLWTRALALIVQHPLLGVGPQHFAHDGADLRTGAHPHDWLLQIGVEWGMPALLCMLGILAVGARSLLRAGAAIAFDDVRNQTIATAMVVALVAVVVDGLFSGVLVMPQSQLAIVLVFGTAAGWVGSLRTLPARGPARASAWGAALITAMAVCGLAWTAAPDFARKWSGADLSAQELAHNPDVHWPRLWEANYF
jgi:O-antigen ligase